MKRKNAAAVALGRKGGMKGGLARAAMLTPAQRSASARNAVMARWAKAKGTKVTNSSGKSIGPKIIAKKSADASDKALVALLNRLRATVDPAEIRGLSDQIERVVFHKQFKSA